MQQFEEEVCTNASAPDGWHELLDTDPGMCHRHIGLDHHVVGKGVAERFGVNGESGGILRHEATVEDRHLGQGHPLGHHGFVLVQWQSLLSFRTPYLLQTLDYVIYILQST